MAAPDEVNVPMIRHWCEAAGDANPVYLDETAAAASVHGGIVAPPTMLQAWVMHPFGTRFGVGETAGERLTALLASRGFTSVVATNCEQTYHRYVRPGDRLTMRSTIDSVSGQKDTALGTGHFVTTRQDYFDTDGELVGSMLFRIIRFRPPSTSAGHALATGAGVDRRQHVVVRRGRGRPVADPAVRLVRAAASPTATDVPGVPLAEVGHDRGVRARQHLQLRRHPSSTGPELRLPAADRARRVWRKASGW